MVIQSTMTPNIASLLDMLIEMEQASQEFYLRLQRMFAHQPEAKAVWWQMAADEAVHIWLLEQARASLTPEQGAAPVDPQIWEQVRALRAISPEVVLERIRTLEDAYQAVHELEHYEFGAVLDFLLAEFFPAEFQREFIRSQLREHLARLGGLRTPEWRRSVIAMR
ncbi:MAG: hypothetical protein ACPLYD_08995 [Anaerolineae bacterium]